MKIKYHDAKHLKERQRKDRFRTRAKENRRVPERFYLVPLPLSTVNEIVAELKIEKDVDKPVSNREWDRMMGLVIAGVVKARRRK